MSLASVKEKRNIENHHLVKNIPFTNSNFTETLQCSEGILENTELVMQKAVLRSSSLSLSSEEGVHLSLGNQKT